MIEYLAHNSDQVNKLHFALLSVVFIFPLLALADTSSIILPTATGTYSEWKPNTAVANWTTVDESSCNGATDYVATSTTAKRDSYSISLSSIPNNSVISAIAVTPCASRATTGTGSSVLNVFYRYNSSSSSDLGSYAPSGTTPTVLATSTWSSLSLTKTSTSTLEVGMVYTSGTKGGRLSRITAQLTYTQSPQLPTATTSAATSVASSSALLNGMGNPSGTSTTAWFRIATSSPGTCSDTFGTRVPLSDSVSLGAGTSSVAYSTTTTSLTQNTTYYYCAIAQNGNGKGYGTVQSFNTSYGPPTIISSDITTNQTWTNGIYVVTNSISVNSGVTLTINSGVIVKFQSQIYSVITVNGTLNTNGTAGSMVYFTSYKDDVVGGDTNGDGSTSPVAGDWGTVKIASGGTGSFKYTVARYGGSGPAYADFYNNGGILTIATSTITSGASYGLYHVSGTTTVASTTIANNTGGYGIYSTGSGLIDISTSYFSGNYIAGSVALGNLVFKNRANTVLNAINQVNGFYVSGTPLSHQTWDAGIPYIVNGTITVNSGISLTINSGAVVKYSGSDGNIIVDGTLNATGSLLAPIYFTSYKDDTVGGDTNGDGSGIPPTAGNWGGIKVNSGGVGSLKYVVARYGGAATYANFHNNGGLLSISNATTSLAAASGIYHLRGTTTVAYTAIVDNISAYGVNAPTGSTGLLDIATSTFSGNFNAGTLDISNLVFRSHANTITNIANTVGGYNVNGTLNYNEVWESGVPYVISSTLTINPNTTLTVDAATIVKLSGTGANMVVGGTLVADSAGSASPIYFTSYNDDNVGGDTNGDGNGSSPSAGNWGMIEVDTGGSVALNFASIRYGGAVSTKMIWNRNNGGGITISNSEIATSTNNGIYQTTGTIAILACDIHDNAYGLYVNNGTANIGSSNIHSNSSYGVYYAPLTGSLNAPYNYWGDGTWGPRIALVQTSGVGDWISTGINYTPYLDRVRYISVNTVPPRAGQIISDVHNKTITYVATSTKYIYALWDGVGTWNAHGASLGGGGVVISTSTVATTSDLWVSDTFSPSAAFVGVYTPNYFTSSGTQNDTLIFNDYFMQKYGSSTQQDVSTHELGHALGLWHSYSGNIMNSYISTQTALGIQDILDYDYCWVGSTPNCR